VMIDRSRSFNSRQQDAIDKSLKYLDEIASRKLGRWQGKADKIVLISIDAIPAVLWEGTLQDFQKVPKEDWTQRFAARSDFEKCTDITTAFKLAGARFSAADAASTSKFLVVFSDLISEPPLNSASTCAKAHPAPTEDFPWQSLSDLSLTVFWLPINQQLVWQRAVNDRGLASHVALYSDSESGVKSLAAPPAAELKMSESERLREKEKIASQIKTVLLIVFTVAGLLVVATLGMVFYARSRGARRRSALRRNSQASPEQMRARSVGSSVRRG